MIRNKYLCAPILLAAVTYILTSGHAFALGDPKAKQNQNALININNTEVPSEPSGLPWFTGPLLAPAGKTVPAYHTNIEPYIFYTNTFGQYDSNWKASTRTPHFYSTAPTFVFSQGLFSRMDLQAVVPYIYNSTDGYHSGNIGDMTFTLGFQVLQGITGQLWHPSLRFTLGETFPTGHFENLNPNKEGVDSTGNGSFQTSAGLDFEQMWTLANDRFFRARFAISYTIPTSVTVHGFNSFGGGFETEGKEKLGNQLGTDIGLEYTLTDHWVPALDIVYAQNDASTFAGTTGTDANGLPAIEGGSSGSAFSLAPAIEYNFNANLGVIGGVWFTVAGRNAAQFASGVFALNYYF